MDKQAHEFYAFHYTCFEAHQYRCPDSMKGSDWKHLGFKTWVQVPKCVPDGVYVFGWASYGQFGDYYSCSYVKIAGGPRTDTCEETGFRPGKTEHGEPGFCRARVDNLGICRKEPCRIDGSRPENAQMIPKQFRSGKTPAIVSRSDYGCPNENSCP